MNFTGLYSMDFHVHVCDAEPCERQVNPFSVGECVLPGIVHSSDNGLKMSLSKPEKLSLKHLFVPHGDTYSKHWSSD